MYPSCRLVLAFGLSSLAFHAVENRARSDRGGTMNVWGTPTATPPRGSDHGIDGKTRDVDVCNDRKYAGR